MKSASRIAVILVALPALFFAAPAAAAQRSFTATLSKVDGCSLASPSGSAAITIDDASGAVTGTLTITNFDTGATVSSAGIHNKNAGDNLVGGFDNVDTDSPNATHAVTTTLNAIALPKILAGDGAIIVKSPAAGCTAGAIRGDLVSGDSTPDAGTDAASTTTPPTNDDAGSIGTGGSSTPVATTNPNEGEADTGCNQRGGGSSSDIATLGFVLAVLSLVVYRRKTHM